MITVTPLATILVHGGAGGTPADADGCLSAAALARRKLPVRTACWPAKAPRISPALAVIPTFIILQKKRARLIAP